MRNVSISKRLGTSMANLACVLTIALLMSGCASENKKQASPLANETGQVSANNESGTSETTGDQEIVCRYHKNTGSRFTHKVCATKAQWAKLEQKNTENTDEFGREINRDAGVNTGSGTDASGGQSMGMPR